MEDLKQFEQAAIEADAGLEGQKQQQQEPEPAPEPEVVQNPEEDARGLLGLLAFGIQKVWPVLEYREETISEGSKRLAPLFVKYNLKDTLFGRWGTEIEAGMFFGSLAYASYMAVQDAKSELKESAPVWWKRPFKWFTGGK